MNKNTDDDIIIEVLCKTGKSVKKSIFDIDIDCKVKRNPKTGRFEPFISRWYRLPGDFSDPIEAFRVIQDFQKKYL